MTRRALSLTSPPDDVNKVHDFLAEVWADSEVAPMDRFRFETALIELASNVIRHAGRGRVVTCTVTVEVSGADIYAELLDDGATGDVVMDTPMPGESAESGRGIPLVRALVDTMDYSRAGDANRWRIAKKLDQ